MRPLAITTPPDTIQAEGAARGLAWKLLYGNHRPELGPAAWDRIVDEVDGPEDIKALGVDETVPLAPFQQALVLLDEELSGPQGSRMEAIGSLFVDRWAAMYQTLTEHLQGQPERMLRVALTEVFCWFFPEASRPRFELNGHVAQVQIDAPLPDGFWAGWLRGFVEAVGADALVEERGQGRFLVSWVPSETEAPSRAHVLLEATRARMLPATVAPVLAGTALAAFQGAFEPVSFALALTGAVALHLAFNLLNDVLDHRRGVDEANLTPTPFSGGSRVIQRGWMGSDAMLGLAATLGLAGAGIGAWLVLASGWTVLALGALGVGVGYAYSGAPFRLTDRGLGELAAGTVFGPLLAAGAFAVQAGSVTGPALLVGVPLGVSMMGVLMVNELPDARWDARTGRGTLAVRWGDLAPWGAGLLLVAPHLALGALVALGAIPVGAALAFAMVPLALFLGHKVRQGGFEADRIAPVQGSVWVLHGTVGVLMAAGIAVEVLL